MNWPTLEYLLEQAGRFHALGINTVPVCCPTPAGWCSARWHENPCKAGGKTPLIQGYPTRAATLLPLEALRAEVRQFFPCNLGIVLPVGCAGVDADSPDAEAEALALGGDAMQIAPCRERRPGRGRAWILRFDPALELHRSTHKGASQAIDILAPGSLFIVPPSVHASMFVYPWVRGRAPWEAPIPLLPDAIRALTVRDPPPRAMVERLVTERRRFEPRKSSRVELLIRSRPNLRRLWSGEKASGDTSQSGVDYALACDLLAAGVPPHEVAEAIAARPGAHRADTEYATHTVTNALAKSTRRGRR